jgi:hypothetical protein
MRLARSEPASIVRPTCNAKTQMFYKGLAASSLFRVFVGANLHAVSRALELQATFCRRARLYARFVSMS